MGITASYETGDIVNGIKNLIGGIVDGLQQNGVDIGGLFFLLLLITIAGLLLTNTFGLFDLLLRAVGRKR